MTGEDESNFSDRLLLTDRQVASFSKNFLKLVIGQHKTFKNTTFQNNTILGIPW